ncbi:hypothetical protein T439DRAFT_333349 [Meredithblackwellia eburnea MCA 4105]
MKLARAVIALAGCSSLAFALSSTTPPPSHDAELLLARPSQPNQIQQQQPQLIKRHGDHDHQQEEQQMDHSDMNEESNIQTTTTPTPKHSDHDHHSHAAPLQYLNETLILETHEPDPLSYFDFDRFPNQGYPGLLIAHVVFMSIAFFVLLPTVYPMVSVYNLSEFYKTDFDRRLFATSVPSKTPALFLKAGGSKLSLIPQAIFLLFALLGHLMGVAYNSATPDLYPNSSHTKLGWVVMVLTLALNAVDVYHFALTILSWYKKKSGAAASHIEETEKLVDNSGRNSNEYDPETVMSPVSLEDDETTEVNWTPNSGATTPPHVRGGSTMSEDTLYDSADHSSSSFKNSNNRTTTSLRSRLSTTLSVAHTVVERSIVVLAYVQVLSGIAVYSGSCRGAYGNGCMAHTIKGSIFVWYGLLTFARYVGAFSGLGWAWNRRPDGLRPGWQSAEFVESFVCFLYGASNTWLERLGKTGAWSIKDMQHASIAVMFWFAGALGMLLESRTVRSWLSQAAVRSSSRPAADIVEPASAAFSFNPFPAMIIGVTGVAMSAHHQTYVFQVEIHALWGLLLGGFAAFRFLTYFFLFLRPPASILPSRPPTEALASLFLTCGGVVFILSTEQVTFAALRHGGDDMMAFLNMTVALVCIWFTWILTLFALKGWASTRSTRPIDLKHASMSEHRSASLSLSRKPSPLRLNLA